MTIQFNSDKTIPWDQRHNEHFTELLNKELKRFSDHITRVELHLSDENGAKKGVDDIRCLMEVRVDGRKPIVGLKQADTIEKSVAGAITKVKASLKKVLEH